MIVLIFALIALAIALVYAFGFSAVTGLADIWKPLLMFLGSFVAINVLYLLVMWLIGLPVKAAPRARQSEICRVAGVSICSFILGHCWTRVHTEGLEKLPKDSRFLLVSNHRFAFDPLVFYSSMPWADLAFLSKKENFSIFVVAQIMRKVLCLPVDRNNDRESLKSILKAIQFIKDDKASIAVFPEGRTNRTADPLLPYRCGVFKIAQKANVPIVICSLVNSRAILRNMFRKHTEVWLDVLDVIPAEELAGKTTIEVGERVHAVMEAGVVRREQAQGLR